MIKQCTITIVEIYHAIFKVQTSCTGSLQGNCTFLNVTSHITYNLFTITLNPLNMLRFLTGCNCFSYLFEAHISICVDRRGEMCSIDSKSCTTTTSYFLFWTLWINKNDELNFITQYNGAGKRLYYITTHLKYTTHCIMHWKINK